MFPCCLLLLVLLLHLSGGTGEGHLMAREAKVTPPQEVALHFLETRCAHCEVNITWNSGGHTGNLLVTSSQLHAPNVTCMLQSVKIGLSTMVRIACNS